MSQRVSYSNTIGTKGSKKGAKNNSISTCAALKSAEKHANHNYSEDEVKKLSSDIDLSLREFNRLFECRDGKTITPVKYLQLYEIVENYYLTLFNRLIENHNEMMLLEGKPDKVIDSYIDYVSKHPKLQLAIQGILQIGDCLLWENHSMQDRLKATDVLMELLEITIERLNSNPNGRFYLAGVANHNNERSPHQHYYGVAVGKFDDGKFIPLRISKSSVFTRETLSALQNEVREKAEFITFRDLGWLFKPKTGEKRKSLSKFVYIWLKNKQKEMSIEIEEQQILPEPRISSEFPFPLFATTVFNDAPYLERKYCPIEEQERVKECDEKSKDQPRTDDNYLRHLLWLIDFLFCLTKRKEGLLDKLMRKILMREFLQMLEDNLVICDLEDLDRNMAMLSTNKTITKESENNKRASLDEVIHKVDEKKKLTPNDQHMSHNHIIKNDEMII